MNRTSLPAIVAFCLLAALCDAVQAKLPPPTVEEQAKAAEEKEKAKAAAAAEEEATRQAQDRVAARYIAEQKAKGITVHPTPVTPPPTAAVTTAQGNTPAYSTTGESPERKGLSGGEGAPRSGHDATGRDTSTHSNQKR